MKTRDNPYPPPIVLKLIRAFALVVSRIVWRIEFCGTENIPQNLFGGLVIAPNHQTYIDAFWAIIPIDRRFRFLAWDKVFGLFGVGSLIRYLGAFPVNIEGGDKEAYQKSVEVLREGATLVIFPEGSRAFSDGKLLEFKTGAVRMALEAGTPILPVTISGGNKFWAREMKYPRSFAKVRVTYHPLFEVASPGENVDLREHARNLTEQLKEIIKQSL